MSAHCQRETRFTSEVAIIVETEEGLLGLLESMRAESCVPSTSADATRISLLLRDHASGVRRLEEVAATGRIVRMTRTSLWADPSSKSQWRHRGCALVDERHPLKRRPTDRELAPKVRPRVTEPRTPSRGFTFDFTDSAV